MTPTRRSLVAATATGAGVALVASPAEAAGYRVRAYTRTKIPAPATLHALQRLTAGYTPALLRQVGAAGGFGRWFDRQLRGHYDDGWYSATARWWHSINASEADLWQRQKDGVEMFWRADANYQCWAMVRRVGSQRQVLETMAEFWEHHFHVPANGEVGPFRTSYGKTIRGLALTRFDQLLPAAVTHPAMSVYLNNANSNKSAPNENLGRELLELHTVGRGHYTEDDVKSSARILTGFRVGLWSDWKAWYDPTRHWTGPVQVMDFAHPNADPDGRAALGAYLRYLAHHPATARRIAHKLAVRFVSDSPPADLVDHLARVYLANKTAIGPVLRALVASSAFRASAGKKVRTPSEDVVATYRAIGARFTTGPSASNDSSAANAILWQSSSLGLPAFGWQRPDGRPDNGAAWSSTSRFLASLDLHYTVSGGWWPKVGVAYRRPAAWLPQPRIRFDHLVDHLSRTILGRGSTPLLLRVACEAAGCGPAAVITTGHRIVRWEMARLVTVFLDSPTHMTR
ncbi:MULTISPECIES: DUF1800 domain-containing protein [Nocardioides]|uniref:DUF1800 domain-containing protein n=1 Tax=Nocardioides vastitatis TaxID=2568655 RepID=A0ABW0ZEX8_9ACTN|nr:DUF1800 domain-containing protein [Nocardioides sp.]